MSAQTRYRTLVHNISRVYSSPDAGRTELLQAGIDEIVGVMSPNTAPQWRTVKSDTERLLHVWTAKEGNSDVSHVVADQIVGLLDELSIVPTVAVAAPVDRIAHVNPYPSLVVQEDWNPVLRAVEPPAPIVSVTKEDDAESVASDDTESIASDDTESVASIPVEDDSEEEEEESDAASVPESVKEVAKEPEPEPEEEEEEEEEVVEPESEEEAEEEEEAGMEVEQVMIRGRTYWKDTNTNKLYAVIRGEDGEDDVGDEVGVLENGKPRFLAK